MKAQPWLPDSYLATRFVYGLRADYQLFVLRFTLVTVFAALGIATVYEESLGEYDLGKQAIVGNLIHDNLDQITHTTSVEACYHQFETLKSFMSAAKPWLPESYFVDRFVYCLQDEYQRFVFRFHPTTVKVAYRLASIYEESIYLKYFPESVTCSENISPGTMMGENQVEDTTQRLPSAHSVCEESVVKDDFPELAIAIDDTCANKEKESATLYHKQDILKTMEVATYHGKDSVAFNVSSQNFSAGMVIPLDSQMAFVQLKVVRNVHEDEEPIGTSPGPKITENELALCVIKDPKVHPPDVSLILGDLIWSLGSYGLLLNQRGLHQRSHIEHVPVIMTIQVTPSFLQLRAHATEDNQVPYFLKLPLIRVLADVLVSDILYVLCRIKHMSVYLKIGFCLMYLCPFSRNGYLPTFSDP